MVKKILACAGAKYGFEPFIKCFTFAIGSLVSVGVVMCVSVKKLRACHQKVGLSCICMLKRTYFMFNLSIILCDSVVKKFVYYAIKKS